MCICFVVLIVLQPPVCTRAAWWDQRAGSGGAEREWTNGRHSFIPSPFAVDVLWLICLLMNLPASIYQTWSTLFFPPANFYICDVLFSDGSFDTFQDLQFKAKGFVILLVVTGSVKVWKKDRSFAGLCVVMWETKHTPASWATWSNHSLCVYQSLTWLCRNFSHWAFQCCFFALSFTDIHRCTDLRSHNSISIRLRSDLLLCMGSLSFIF